MYQAHTVAMGAALRAASDTLVELSTADLTPGDLVNAIEDIGSMLAIGREHAVRMCIYDVLMQTPDEAYDLRKARCAFTECYGEREASSRYCWAHTPRSGKGF